MLKKHIQIMLTAAASVFLLSASAYCLDSVVVNINQIGFIVNPTDQTDRRALLDFDLPARLDSTCKIISAELVFGVTVTSQFEVPLNLLISPLTTDWASGTCNWATPWTNPGGDYIKERTTFGYIKQTGDSNISIEVTRLIQGFHSGRIPNHGLIIRQSGYERHAVTAKRLNPQGPFAKLVIFFVIK